MAAGVTPYPTGFKVLSDCIGRLKSKFGVDKEPPEYLIFQHILAIQDIEHTTWHLLKDAYRDPPQYQHVASCELFSRPVIEYTLQALLFVHDSEYIRRWQIYDWSQMVVAAHFDYSMFENVAQEAPHIDALRKAYGDYSAILGFEQQEIEAAIAYFKGEAKAEHRSVINQRMGGLKKVPGAREIAVGDAKKNAILSGSSNLAAAQVLYRHYRFHCHSTHAGKQSLMICACLRGDIDPPMSRLAIVEHELQPFTLWTAISCQLLLATILSHPPCSSLALENTALASDINKCWELLRTQSKLGAEFWEYWYKPRFGVL